MTMLQRALILGLFGIICSPQISHATSHPRSRDVAKWAPAGIGSNLQELLVSRKNKNIKRFDEIISNTEAVWQGDLLQVQVRLRPGVSPLKVTDAALHALHGRAGVRAIDVMNVWLPLEQVPVFAKVQRQHIAFLQLPWRPHFLGAGEGSGPTVSQGLDNINAAPEALACVDNIGAGVKVAVIDGGFEKLPASIKSGETNFIEGKYATIGGTHGTMCAEVVADVAPGATIRAITANSYAVLQQFQAEMKMGNPNKIDIVSHSVIWLGMSFGRNEGKACEVTKVTRDQGVAWVNAAGNSGSGQFHKGKWLDSNGDKKHEFSGKDPTLKFRQRWNNGTIKLTFDWDDYAKRETDIDLFLFRENDQGFMEQIAQSNKKQGPYTPPVEQVLLKKAPKGVYAVVLVAKSPVPKGMGYRLINLGSGASSFSIWHKNGNVYDPASCDGVLTVGAIHHSRYESGPQEGYSSFGPTPDGRMKPEVMAPTSVKTSVGNFGGTSCACPHAAGALALYKAATEVSAVALIQRLIDDAEPMGPADPNDIFGHGRVMLRTEGVGWACSPKGEPQPCTTACGSQGSATCTAACGLGTCTPPVETCNDVDDDCDGETDEGCSTPVEPTPDAGGTMDSGTSLDVGVEDEVKANDAGVAQDVQTTKPSSKVSGGCTASRRAGSSRGALLILLMTAIWALRRRRLA